MADTSVVLPDTWVSRLLVCRHGDTIAIALEDEDDWEALTSCTVDSFEDVAFGSGGFPVRSDSYTVYTVVVESTC